MIDTQHLLDTRVAPWVEKLPWQSDFPVHFDESEGYRGNGVIGARTGPMDCLDFENVAHEMAHAIEILECGRASALARSGWGLRIKSSLEVMGEVFYEPTTMQATEREARVCGIQLRILEAVGHPDAEGFIERHASVLERFMPDYVFGGKSSEERVATRMRLIKDAYHQWPLARVQAAWRAAQPRLEAVRLAQETKPSPRRRMGR